MAGNAGTYRAALVAAAASGDLDHLLALVASRAPDDVTPATRLTFMGVALLRGASAGHADVVRALLRAGDLDVSKPNGAGNTALHCAAEGGHARCVAVLLEAGAKLTSRNNEGKTPIAVSRTHAIRAAISAEVRRRKDAETRSSAAASLSASPARTPNRARSSATMTPTRASSSPRSSSSSRGAASFAAPPPSAAASLAPPARLALATPNRTPPPNSYAAAAASPRAPASPGVACILQKLRDDLRCVVCLRDFCSEGEGTSPVTLPCGHNFCDECVLGMRGRGDRARAFKCPLDRTMFSRNLELRVNTTMRDLIAYMGTRVRGGGGGPLALVSASGAADAPRGERNIKTDGKQTRFGARRAPGDGAENQPTPGEDSPGDGRTRGERGDRSDRLGGSPIPQPRLLR